jgi:sugar lactone lactonase YvrE
MGIAWEAGNAYWVFDGFHGALTRFEFTGDHGPGGSSHADGIVTRFAEGQVSRIADVPSHMAFDKDTGLLYIADTGNSRIAILDTTSGTPGAAISPNFDGTRQSRMDGAVLETLVDGEAVDMIHPSGLELHDGTLYVTDNKTSRIFAFTLEGELIDYLDTGRPEGSIMGLAFDDEGLLYTVDCTANSVLRVSPK